MDRVRAFLLACAILFGGILIVPASGMLMGSLAPCPGPCPPGTICKIEIVYAYMIHDPEAKKADVAWMGRGGFDLVHWTPQNKAWITTRRAEVETQKASMLGPRGQRSVIRKFFLMESNRPLVKRPRDDMSLFDL